MKKSAGTYVKQANSAIVLFAYLAFTVLALFTGCVQSVSAKQVNVTDVRFSDSRDSARIVLEFDAPPSFSYFSLANPDRVVIDLQNVDKAFNLSRVGLSGNKVSKLRQSRPIRPKDSRIVIETSKKLSARLFTLAPADEDNKQAGHRLVIDLIDPNPPSEVAEGNARSNNAEPNVAVNALEPDRDKDITTVIDAGRGSFYPALIGSSAVTQNSNVTDVRFSDSRDSARIVLEFDVPPSFSYFSLANPDRVVIDLQNVDKAFNLSRVGLSGNKVSKLRHSKPLRPRDSRIVIEISKKLSARLFTLAPADEDDKQAGHRLVIDLIDPNPPSEVAISNARSNNAEPNVAVNALEPDRDQDITTVIDAGHEGVDPGSIGPSAVTQNASGEVFVTLQTNIRFTGNTQYSSITLNEVLADAIGKTYSLEGLQGLTDRITAYYRSNGFAFARALLPVQAMTDGALLIQIVEGHYDNIKAIGDSLNNADAQVFLNLLQTGDIIHTADLERVSLILDDQPGFKTTPVLRPGTELGAANLLVEVERDQDYRAEIRIDNYGNRYTGRHRIHVDLNINSPFLFGDQVTLNTLYSDEDLWLGALNYNLPIGGSGLRANAGYAHNYYELGKEFSDSEVHGTAQVSSAGLSYPILRSHKTNVNVALSYQQKVLNNSNDITLSSNTNRSDSIPLSLNFDHRDTLAGGGISYGTLSWTSGNLTVATGNIAIDNATAKTAGSYDKFNLNLARLQSLPGNLTLFSRVSAQWAGSNLNSSEKFGLGGANNVRAYPVGEAYGDVGVLVQLEVRYALKHSTLYTFYDAGSLRTNKNSWAAGNNKRSLSGAGVGLQLNLGQWALEASAAWQTSDNLSNDEQSDSLMKWASIKYEFENGP